MIYRPKASIALFKLATEHRSGWFSKRDHVLGSKPHFPATSTWVSFNNFLRDRMKPPSWSGITTAYCMLELYPTGCILYIYPVR